MIELPEPVEELTPESRAHLARLAAAGVPPVYECTPEQARTLSDAAVARLSAPLEAPIDVTEVTLAGAEGALRARLYRPHGTAEPSPAAVFLHGGGWVIGNVDSYDDVCRRLADGSGGVIVSVDYRLAPEHPFPAPVEDSVAAVRDVLERASELGIDGTRVAVAGDSAGAALATAAARRAVNEGWDEGGGPALAGQLLIYPTADGGEDWPSMREYATGYALTEQSMRWFYEHYLPDPALRGHPDAAPLHATDLGGMARAHVLVASHDPLRDEGIAYARALAAAGVPVTTFMAQGLLHGYIRWTAVVPEAAEHLRALGAVLRRWWSEPEPTRAG